MPAIRGRAPVTGSTRLCVRPLVCWTTFPLARFLPSPSSAGPVGRPLCEGFRGTLKRSDSRHPGSTGGPLRCPVRTWPLCARPEAGSPGFRPPCFDACQRSPTPPGPSPPCQNGVDRMAFRVFGARRHPGRTAIAGLNPLPAGSPVNAAPAPLPTPAHDSGPVWLAPPSLSGTDTLHHCAGLSRRLPERCASAAAESGSIDWVGRGRGSLRAFSPGPPPNRAEPFPCYTALQWARFAASGPRVSHPLPRLSSSTCGPSPCGWLSQPLTTTAAL